MATYLRGLHSGSMHIRTMFASVMRKPLLLCQWLPTHTKFVRLASKTTTRPYQPQRRSPRGKTTGADRGSDIERYDPMAVPDYVLWPGDTQRMPLHNGRGDLGYAEMGARDPKRLKVPFLAFPGTPGSRLSYWAYHHWLQRTGIPLIVVEKPGYGISTYRADYNMVDLARDARQLMFEHLGYKRCRVIGISGGGPPALAMSYISSPKEVVVTGIMCGLTPPQAGTYGATFKKKLFHAWTNTSLVLSTKWEDFQMRKLNKLQRLSISQRPPAWDLDRHLKYDREWTKLLEIREWRRYGTGGYQADFRNLGRHWGFELKDISDKKPIEMVYGTEDINVPIEGARWMAEQLHKKVVFKERGNRDHNQVQEDNRKLIERMMQYR